MFSWYILVVVCVSRQYYRRKFDCSVITHFTLITNSFHNEIVIKVMDPLWRFTNSSIINLSNCAWCIQFYKTLSVIPVRNNSRFRVRLNSGSYLTKCLRKIKIFVFSWFCFDLLYLVRRKICITLIKTLLNIIRNIYLISFTAWLSLSIPYRFRRQPYIRQQ